MGDNQLIKTAVVSLLLILLIISPSITGVGKNQTIWGFINYSDASWIPNDVVVRATNLKNDNYITTTTLTGETGHTGLYIFADIFAIPGTENGDTIKINVSYGGCTGEDTVVINISLPSQEVNITIYGNLPPAIPSQPSGNNSGYHGVTYNYSTSTTDPDGDQIYYWYEWGDDTNSAWVGPYNSSTTINASHIWNEPGSYQLKVKAKDEHDAEPGIGWSNTLNINMINQPPNAPSIPSGLSNGYTNTSYSYSTNATDPNNDQLYYWFEWGDSTNSSWIGPYASGTTVNASHIWTEIGEYKIIVKAHDGKRESNWSEALIITIENDPPDAPTITGETNGKVGVEYEYTFNATDPEGANVYYWIEWFEDDPSAKWEGPYASGKEITRNHTWYEKGTYTIRAKAKDVYGAESDWGTLKVTMPKNRIYINRQLILKILEQLPILRYLLFRL